MGENKHNEKLESSYLDNRHTKLPKWLCMHHSPLQHEVLQLILDHILMPSFLDERGFRIHICFLLDILPLQTL